MINSGKNISDNYRTSVSTSIQDISHNISRMFMTIPGINRNVPFQSEIIQEIEHHVNEVLGEVSEKVRVLEETNAKLVSQLSSMHEDMEEIHSIANVGIWKWDLQSDEFWWSERLYKIYGHGYESESLSLDQYINLALAEDIDKLYKGLEHLFKTHEPQSFYYRINKSNDGVRTLYCKAEIQVDKHGTPVLVKGVCQDVTEMKLIEEQLLSARINLEQQVKERTQELNAALNKLQNQILEKENTIQQKSQLASIVSNTYDAILGKDLNGRVNSWNRACEQLYGYSKEEMIGNSVSVLYPDDKKDEIQTILDKVKAGERINHFETERVTKDGDRVHVILTVSPIKDKDGNIIGASSIAKDITAWRKYESELNAIAKFPQENPNPVMRFSFSGQILIFTNKAAEKFISYFDKESEVRNKWIRLINEVFRKGVPVEHELELGGRTYLFNLVPINEGGYINLYGKDITSERIAEEKIKRLLFALSQTQNAVVLADTDGKIQWTNKAFEKISGYTLEDVKDTHGENLRHGKPTGLFKDNPHFKKMMRTRKAVSYENKNFKKSGEEYWTITTISPVIGTNDEIEGIVAVDSDITEKKKAEMAMLKAKRLAEESAKSKELFLANMSHEIRTPMNAIMGIVQLLRETDLDKEQLKFLASLDFAGENLLRIINDILDLSKIDSGKVELEKIDFSIRDVLNEIMNTMEHEARDKGIDFNLEVDSEVPDHVNGDPVRLNQILFNLISNAIKFTDEGKVGLTITRKKQSKKKEVIQFIVEDTGIGIEEELQESIFNDFEQAHNETTRKHGGTGLGLSIVKRLTKAFNGKIELDSEVGRGSKFSILIPFDKASHTINHAQGNEASPDHEELSNVTTLLVEDNKLNQMVARKFLEKTGMKVDIANHGKEACSIIEEHPKKYDLILMDIQMPNMDGYQTAQAIREEFKLTIPIIAMTAHALKGEKDKCLSFGMDDYISKPLKKNLLLTKIEKLLKKE